MRPARPRDRGAEAEFALSQTSNYVHRAVDGDVESLAWLVTRFTPLLTAQAAYRLSPALRRHFDPEDLVLDVWAIVIRRISDLRAEDGRGKGALIRFLGTVLLHRARDLARLVIVRGTAGDRPPDEGGADPASPHSSVVSRIVRDERRDAVREAIESLNSSDRDVLFLRGLEGHPLEEVAVLVGTTPNAVSIRYHRALKKLRKRLHGALFDEFAED